MRPRDAQRHIRARPVAGRLGRVRRVMKTFSQRLFPWCVACLVVLATGCGGSYWKPDVMDLRPEIRAMLESGQVTRCYIEKRHNVLRGEVSRRLADGALKHAVVSVPAGAADEFFAYLDEHGVDYEYVKRE